MVVAIGLGRAFYTSVIVPQLPGFHSVPMWMWTVMATPCITVCLVTGWRVGEPTRYVLAVASLALSAMLSFALLFPRHDESWLEPVAWGGTLVAAVVGCAPAVASGWLLRAIIDRARDR